MNPTTPIYKSKRSYITLFTALAPFIPYVGPWISANPELYSGILATLFGAVGIATTRPMSLK